MQEEVEAEAMARAVAKVNTKEKAAIHLASPQ